MELDPIARVRSPYKEKFAIPRQPGLVTAAKGRIEFLAGYQNDEMLQGIEQFSHLWLIFVFHHTQEQGWKPSVRPPRLGGNAKMGVLASRSTFRPNPIGLSVVKLENVIRLDKDVSLEISGMDLVDGTPLLDIKPYLPYADSLPDAQAGYAQQEPDVELDVVFTQNAQAQLSALSGQAELQTLIEQVLAQDPRPAYRKGKPDAKQYGVKLAEFNVCFMVINSQCQVTDIQSLT
ncbi:tRNA (N6-threonylcarbamoyladenosine(37)-N6)-methyltransferase TrmO [Motilimonas pumila]|uniref:tRNA (N6-threonylcarbamoyladenosine(37)-N6)-methyltransferase TrmO n=1 Tax=Motilimonas pumila TaxID=2303987 RepID=A0A418YEQ8_9GAMM|nr:tRNA (N6-threonylcarbamoyladenosine(37)-N6)-methyltransferase TrmO [Motilimonas pumila]RJG47625.1 tRNA (N6-threonylcarbamoyladenosine(37)-N6)-methyltransferase TrmO [Motilimonas pumila]